ncbi:MAG: site-2 protease family protein [Solirubrobacterales bacterium]
MIKVNRYFFPYIIICIITGFRGEIAISVISVLFHEFVHYFTAKILGFSGFDVELTYTGACLKVKSIEDASIKEDIIISISGPLFNLSSAVIFYYFYKKTGSESCYIIFSTNLYIGIFNLMPAFPLDGGRIFRAFLGRKTIYSRANIIMVNISMCIGILFIFLYISLNFHGRNNFSLGVAGLFIIISCIKERERIGYIIMGDIIRKRSNFIKKGFIQNQNTSIYYKKDLLRILALIEKNRYNIFMVLDEDMQVIGTIYEQEAVDALKKYGNITIEEYLNRKLL